tara:strand:+ start:1820 stop:1996 length:177 start_codon:yes stop_codon:yes gene_type:complete
MLSKIFFVAGLVSIIASIVAWNLASGNGTDVEIASAERWGIFVGLWAPTFLILSEKLK